MPSFPSAPFEAHAQKYSYKVVLAKIGKSKTVGDDSYDLGDVVSRNQDGAFCDISGAKARVLLTKEYMLLFIHDDIYFIDCLRFKRELP